MLLPPADFVAKWDNNFADNQIQNIDEPMLRDYVADTADSYASQQALGQVQQASVAAQQASVAAQATANAAEQDIEDEVATRAAADTALQRGVTANTTALAGKQNALGYVPENTLNKGADNGYAPLVGGVVPAINLPSYVDDVLNYPTSSGFPAVGEKGKIYTTDDDLDGQWRWIAGSPSRYRRYSSAPGSSDAVAEGTVNLYFTPGRVRATLLDNYAKAPVSRAVSSTDSLLVALSILEKKADDNTAALNTSLVSSLSFKTGDTTKRICFFAKVVLDTFRAGSGGNSYNFTLSLSDGTTVVAGATSIGAISVAIANLTTAQATNGYDISIVYLGANGTATAQLKTFLL